MAAFTQNGKRGDASAGAIDLHGCQCAADFTPVLADGKVCVMRHSVIKKDTNGNDYRAHGPIVCTGTINECEEFATDDDYVWRISRDQQFGGYYYRKSDRSILFVKEHNDGSDNHST